eukprot:TRINITY_DN10446_c0_g1_i1.p1 TRINITY_DN10446_c0_g1~~TRINITY_DN10446_c0_g1_i1.p1  ORF type:complete len:381 (-),score=77.34 TRINITY_DN10446_c0_g1_i1:151-1293(-)
MHHCLSRELNAFTFNHNRSPNISSKSHKRRLVQRARRKQKQLSRDELTFLAAVTEGDLEAVEAFHHRGIDVDMLNYDGRSAVHLAASHNQLEVLQFLVEKGANILVKDRWGEIPLLDSLRFKNSETSKYLGSLGSVIKDSEIELGILMCDAVSKNDEELLEIMIDAGVSPNVFDYNGRTPLHIAASSGNFKMTKYLVENGADPHPVDRNGNTPLSQAKKTFTDPLLIEFLRSQKKDDRDIDFWELRDHPEFKEHLEVCLRSLSQRGFFEYAEVWLPSKSGKFIRSADFFYSEPELEKEFSEFFKNYTENYKHINGNGIEGIIWSKKQPFDLNDVVDKIRPTRYQALQSIGIRSGFGIPIIFNDEVLFVLTFYDTSERTKK